MLISKKSAESSLNNYATARAYSRLCRRSRKSDEDQLGRWVGPFMEAGISIAALAVVRRGDASVSEAAHNITDFTAGIMSVDEDRLARELQALVEKGYAEFHDGRYHITLPGQVANVPDAEAVEPLRGRHEQPVGLLLRDLKGLLPYRGPPSFNF